MTTIPNTDLQRLVLATGKTLRSLLSSGELTLDAAMELWHDLDPDDDADDLSLFVGIAPASDAEIEAAASAMALRMVSGKHCVDADFVVFAGFTGFPACPNFVCEGSQLFTHNMGEQLHNMCGDDIDEDDEDEDGVVYGAIQFAYFRQLLIEAYTIAMFCPAAVAA